MRHEVFYAPCEPGIGQQATTRRVRILFDPEFFRGDLFRIIRHDDRNSIAALRERLGQCARDIRKPPATAELLVWLAVLAAQGTHRAQDLRTCPLAKLPALSTLVKDRDDLAQIG